MGLYKVLKEKQAQAKRDQRVTLLPSEISYISQIEAIIGYEIALHVPLGAKFILGADDAEQILQRIHPQYSGFVNP